MRRRGGIRKSGPGSHLISFSYLAFPLARLSISKAVGGGPDYLVRLEKMSLAGSYITCPALCALIFPTLPLARYSHLEMHSEVFGVHHECLAFPQSIISRAVAV